MITKKKAIEIKEISQKITSGKYHMHADREVPPKTLKLWLKRGFNAHKIGLIHVRYAEIPGKKYTFPMHFWIEE